MVLSPHVTSLAPRIFVIDSKFFKIFFILEILNPLVYIRTGDLSNAKQKSCPNLQKNSVPIPEEQMRTGVVIFLDEPFIQNCVKFKSDNKGLVCKLNARFGSSNFVWFDCCIDVSQDSSSIWTMNSDISILYCLAALSNKLQLIGPLNSSCVG